MTQDKSTAELVEARNAAGKSICFYGPDNEQVVARVTRVEALPFGDVQVFYIADHEGESPTANDYFYAGFDELFAVVTK